MPEDDLLDALHGLGADHEPDTAAIRRRMESRTKVVELRHRPPSATRRRPVLLSAAAAILIGGGVTVAASQLSPASSSTPSDPLPVKIQPFATPSTGTTPTAIGSTTKASPTTQPDDSPTGTQTSKTDTQSTGSATERSATSQSAAGTGSAGSTVSSTVEPMSTDQSITLSDADEDWLAIGTRNDMKTIRKKAATDSALLEFTAPDSAASVDGPFLLSWSGGAPEQDRADSPRWLQTDDAVVTVTASSAARTVTLYVGNALQVSSSGSGLEESSVQVGDDALGYVVTLRIPAHAGATTIALSSSRGPVHLIAATASTD